MEYESNRYLQKSIMNSRKTEQEIINELKNKRKYNEWVSLGSKFGLISNTINAKFFLVRPYKYYDVDKNIVNVSMVQSNYRPDVDNIAVFKQFVIKYPSYTRDFIKFTYINYIYINYII